MKKQIQIALCASLIFATTFLRSEPAHAFEGSSGRSWNFGGSGFVVGLVVLGAAMTGTAVLATVASVENVTTLVEAPVEPEKPEEEENGAVTLGIVSGGLSLAFATMFLAGGTEQVGIPLAAIGTLALGTSIWVSASEDSEPASVSVSPATWSQPGQQTYYGGALTLQAF